MTVVAKYLLLFLLLIGASSCSRDLYTYRHYEDNLYVFLKNGQSPSDLKKLQANYKELISVQKRGRKVPPPGIHAEYAIILAKRGKEKEAIKQFEQEKILYPESQIYVDNLMQSLGL